MENRDTQRAEAPAPDSRTRGAAPVPATRIRGLYAVTDSRMTGARLHRAAEQAIAGGARVVQYRQKDRRSATYDDDARALRLITRRLGAVFIVNDDVDLAAAVGADGVHLGREDDDPARARTALGDGRLVGVSCYDDLGRALAAEAGGADYVAFGSFYPSPTKPGAVKAPLELLARAKGALSVPVVAIGGIRRQNGGALIRSGADALAVISEVFAAEDVEAAAAGIAALFVHHQPKVQE